MGDASPQQPSGAPSDPEVARFILDQVGDVGRPRGALEPVRDLAHLPGGRLGLFWGLANAIAWRRRGNEAAGRELRRHGPVFRYQLAMFPTVCVAAPEHIVAIARNEDRAWSAALAWGHFLDGLDADATTADMPGALDFAPHGDARRFLQPAFKASALAGYLDIAHRHFERATRQWVASGRVVFKPAVRRLFAAVANEVFLGVVDPAEAALFDRAMEEFWRGSMALSKRPWLSPTWRRAQQGYRRLRDVLRSRVEDRRRTGGSDLFSRMCQNSEQVGWLDDDGLVRLFLGLMAAAFDTTSHGVTSMAYLLAVHPEWQDRLREEALAVAPGQLELESLKELEQHEWAWKESLRRFPVASHLPRRALRDVDLAGRRIPAGTFVLAMIGLAMQDPAWWTEPDRFDPERFSPARAEDKRHRGAFLPFGAGSHACIGAQLSTLEAKAFWWSLLRQVRIRLARPYRGLHQYRPIGVVSGQVELIVSPIR